MSIADGGSPEAVALALAWHIAAAETDGAAAAARRDDPRRYFLDLYGECLAATKAKRSKRD